MKKKSFDRCWKEEAKGRLRKRGIPNDVRYQDRAEITLGCVVARRDQGLFLFVLENWRVSERLQQGTPTVKTGWARAAFIRLNVYMIPLRAPSPCPVILERSKNPGVIFDPGSEERFLDAKKRRIAADSCRRTAVLTFRTTRLRSHFEEFPTEQKRGMPAASPNILIIS